MLYIYILLINFIYSVSSINKNRCIKCKHYIPIKTHRKDNEKMGRCNLFINKNDDYIIYPFTPKETIERQYVFSSRARTDEEMCGKNGKKYERSL